jgi:DNA-binding MarR family transcriptional regulator
VYILLIMNELSERDRFERLARTCISLNLRRTARAVSNYYDDIFTEACGLRATQIPPLVVLYLAGPQSINEIAGKLEINRTTLSRNLRPLEEAGMLETAQGDDLRLRIVKLTDRGRELLLNVLPIWEKLQERMVQGLGEGRFDDLLTELSDVAGLARET